MEDKDSIEIEIGRWFVARAKGRGVFMLPVIAIVAGALWLWIQH